MLAPALVDDSARDRIVVATTAGHLLMFSVADLPELDKGKGNKLIEIPKAKLAGGERVAGIAVVAEGKGEVTLYAGARKLTLKWADLVEYGGSRAARGGLAAAWTAACGAHRDVRLTRGRGTDVASDPLVRPTRCADET